MSQDTRQPGESLSEFAARVRAREAAGPVQQYADDLIPQPSPTPKRADDGITALIDADSIIDAYTRWCRKMVPNVGGKRESIMVSCPNPSHPDTDPSAWVNLDKNAGICPLCGGFDVYDIFVWNTGSFNKDTYKTDGTFPAVRRAMATDLGYVVHRTLGGTEYVEQIQDDLPVVTHISPAPSVAPEAGESAGAQILAFPGQIDDPLDTVDRPPIDWRNLLDPHESTFLYHWLEACSIDDLPEEFYFWLGLMALGSAVGNNVKLADRWPVRTNLLLCLTGPTGMGKSRAANVLVRLMREAFRHYPGTGGGVKIVPMPGSAESLVDSFNDPIYDPANPRIVMGYNPVRGLVMINELSSLMGRAARVGNVMKPTLMDFYDTDMRVSLQSRGAGLVEAIDHHAQVISTTQPRAMRAMLSQTDDDSGFLNRWVFATGVPKRLMSMGGITINVNPLVDLIRDIRSWGGTVREITVDQDAFDLWDEFFHREIVPLKLDEEASIFVRLDLLMKKLMLLLTIDKKQDSVNLRTMEQVLTLWPYLVGGYSQASAAVNSNAEEDLSTAIELVINKCMKSTGRGATTRDFQRSMKAIWKRQGSQAVLKQIETLVKLGMLKEVTVTSTEGKGGRPTVRYEIADEATFGY